MDTDLEVEQELNETMTPSVTDTDAEESDPDEGNTSEEVVEVPIGAGDDVAEPLDVVAIKEAHDSSGEGGETGERLVAPSAHDDESEHHCSARGIQSTTGTSDPLDRNSRSCQGDGTDIQTDENCSRGVSQLEAPRGTTNADGVQVVVDSTTDAVSNFMGKPAEDAHLLGVIPDQQISGQPRAEALTFQPVTNEGTYVVCHPSKLIRDNSASTLQPHLKHLDTQGMGPNSRVPSRVDEGSEDMFNDALRRTVSATLDSTHKEVDVVSDDVDACSTKNAPSEDQTERDYGQGAVRSAADAPPSPFRFSPPSAEDILETGSVVIAPPGTIVFQHSNGEHAYLPHTYQHNGYGYQIPIPVVQHGMNAQMIPTPPAGGGRRKITLRLQEDTHDSSRKSFFFRRSNRNLSSPLQAIEEGGIDRGTVTVSWFEGTSSSELQEHVRKTVIRKMNLESDARLADLRIIDESEIPHEGRLANSS